MLKKMYTLVNKSEIVCRILVKDIDSDLNFKISHPTFITTKGAVEAKHCPHMQ